MTRFVDLKSALPDMDVLEAPADTARFVAGVRGETGKALLVLHPRTTSLAYRHSSPQDFGHFLHAARGQHWSGWHFDT